MTEHLLDIQKRYKSKKELLRFLRNYVVSRSSGLYPTKPSSLILFFLQYIYLPSDTHCTLNFVQGVVTGRKSFLYIPDIKPLNVPVRPELSVANCWADAILLPGVLDHFPNEWAGARRVDRKYFWMILATLHPEWVKSIIRGSREARAAH